MRVARELKVAALEGRGGLVRARVHGDEGEGEGAEARVRERDARGADVHRFFARHAYEREGERAEPGEAAE